MNENIQKRRKSLNNHVISPVSNIGLPHNKSVKKSPTHSRRVWRGGGNKE
jgi:hypothetical protein